MERDLSSEENASFVHADILANLIYIVVGFSLVTALPRKMAQVKDLETFMEFTIYFMVLVVPSVIFIGYAKRSRHKSWMAVLDYIFLFFLSTFVFSLIPEYGDIRLYIGPYSIPVGALSAMGMLVYAILVQSESTVTTMRNVGFTIRGCNRVMEKLGIIAFLTQFLLLFSLAITSRTSEPTLIGYLWLMPTLFAESLLLQSITLQALFGKIGRRVREYLVLILLTTVFCFLIPVGFSLYLPPPLTVGTAELCQMFLIASVPAIVNITTALATWFSKHVRKILAKSVLSRIRLSISPHRSRAMHALYFS